MLEHYVMAFWFGLIGAKWYFIISLFTLPISALYHLYRLTKED
jgi:hypothetical protein